MGRDDWLRVAYMRCGVLSQVPGVGARRSEAWLHSGRKSGR
jgi:hypothetical protein